MAIQKISRENISDQVFRQMREEIASGEWKPGDRIPSENDLAEQFGVSRVTVRNALQKLSAQGLIETRFGDGSYVSTPDAAAILQPLVPAVMLNVKQFEEILQMRMMIEAPICREACRLAKDEEIKTLAGIYQEMIDTEKNLKRFAVVDYRFHMEIVKMTGNSVMIEMYRIIQDSMKRFFDRIVQARGVESGLYYHKRILQAFMVRDPMRAEQEMKAHIEEMYKSFKDIKIL